MKASVYASVVSIGELMSGTSADQKEWKKKTVVLAPNGEERKLAAEAWNDSRIAQLDAIHPGDAVIATVDVYAHEFGGKWYNRCDLLSIRRP